MRLRDNLTLDRMKIDSYRPDPREANLALLDRASAALAPGDYLLFELSVKNRLTFRQLSRLMSAPPGTICRRFRRVLNRLRDPFTVALINPNSPLPDQYRQIALEHIVHRKTLRELADAHRLSADEVRRMVEFVRGWYRGLQARNRV